MVSYCERCEKDSNDLKPIVDPDVNNSFGGESEWLCPECYKKVSLKIDIKNGVQKTIEVYL